MTTTTETVGFAPAKPFGVRLAAQAVHLWQAFNDRRRERQTLAQLSRYEPRLLIDMGFDPAEVYKATRGPWNEVDPWRFDG
jgi:uncharacterized protein YjiS (DUF1127 family)